MGHTYSNILVHVIFSTKDRRPTIAADFRQRLYEYMSGVARKEFIALLDRHGVQYDPARVWD